jgi:hypothetical protein
MKLSRIAAVAREPGEASVGYGADAFVPFSAVSFGRALPLRSSIIAAGLRYSGANGTKSRIVLDT